MFLWMLNTADIQTQYLEMWLPRSIDRCTRMCKKRNDDIKQELQGKYLIYKIKEVTVENSGSNPRDDERF